MNKIAKPLLRALKGEKISPLPIWLMRQAGRYLPEYRETRNYCTNFLDLCHSSELSTEVALQPMRRFDLDGSILFSDILVVPEALGRKVTFVKNEGPVLTPIQSLDDIARLNLVNIEERFFDFAETIRKLKIALAPSKTVIGFAGAPWTVAAYMVEGRGSRTFQKARVMARTRQKDFQKLINVLVEATSRYLCEQIKFGADTVQLFDSWAGLLPPDEFDRWVIAPTREIVDRVKKVYPDIPIIGFPRGAGTKMIRYAEKTSVDALSLDETVSLDWAIQNLSNKVVLQGNLDPVLLTAGGKALDEGIDHILDVTHEIPFVFNLGHGITPETPPDNVKHLVDRIRGAR